MMSCRILGVGEAIRYRLLRVSEDTKEVMYSVVLVGGTA